MHPNPGCGLPEYYSVLKQYEVLTLLRETYGGIGSFHQSDQADQSWPYSDPSGLNLPVLLDGQTVLERCIDATVEVMEKRLDATQDIINISQQLET